MTLNTSGHKKAWIDMLPLLSELRRPSLYFAKNNESTKKSVCACLLRIGGTYLSGRNLWYEGGGTYRNKPRRPGPEKKTQYHF